MLIIDNIWLIIKSFLIHNIKIHGLHLKNNKEIIMFNKVIKNLPKPKIPRNGPRIIYSSAKQIFRYVKYIYNFNPFDKSNNYINQRTLIEIQKVNDNYDNDYLTYDSLFRYEYFNQHK